MKSTRPQTRFRWQETASLLGSAVALVFVSLKPFTMMARGVGELVGARIWPAHPDVTAVTLLLVAAILLRVWRWTRRGRSASALTPTSGAPPLADMAAALKSLAEIEGWIAYAMIGIGLALVFSGNPLADFGQIFGSPVFAESHQPLAGVLGLLAFGLTLAWFLWMSDWRGSDHRLSEAARHDPVVLRLHFVVRHTALTLWTALLLAMGIGLCFWFADVWLDYLPYTAVVLVLGIVVALGDTLTTLRKQRKAWRSEIRDALVNQVVAFVIGGVMILLVTVNLEGLQDSSVVFAQAAPSMRVGFLAMPALFGVFVAGVLLRFAHAGHWVRVFISFQHARESTALELEHALKVAGLTVRRIPFRSDYAHDLLLKDIQDEIRRCDVMVCLPGAQPSFVENEVLVASTLRKFIVFVVGENEPRLPNTAYYGYPVFRLARVARLGYQPVSELILLVAGNWRASFRFFRDSWSRHFGEAKTLAWIVAVYVVGSYVVGGGVALATGGPDALPRFLRWFHRAYLDLLGDWLMIWIWLNAFLIGCVFALVNLLRTRRVLRQEILTGHLTHAVLRKHLGNGKRARRLLASLWRKPPPAEHDGHASPGA